VKSRIVYIDIKGKTLEECEGISRSVAKLFLGLSSGNINMVVDSIIDQDQMNASFILSIYLWKNFTTIIQNL
jgi:hypothetical protein